MIIFNPSRYNWTPSELTVAAWYDAEDTSTIVESSGAVSEWKDKSGNGNHVAQGTGANQPTTNSVTVNGLNVIDWGSGANDKHLDLDGDGNQNWQDVYVVARYDGGSTFAGYDGIVSGYNVSGTDDGAGIVGETPNTNFFRPCWGDNYFLNGASTGTPVNVLPELEDPCVYSMSADSSIAVDGIVIGNDRNLATNRGWKGVIAEVVIFSSKLSDSDRQKMEGYLAWKWGTTAKLPNDHPYKFDGTLFGYTSVWSPQDLDLEMWFDPSVVNGITASSGSVSQLNDASGNDRHLKQATGSLQPVTGTRTIRSLNTFDFDGADKMETDTMSPTMAATGDSFVIGIFKYDSFTNNPAIFDLSGDDRWTELLPTSPDLIRGYRQANGSTGDNPQASLLNPNEDVIFSCQYDISLDKSLAWVDGALILDGSHSVGTALANTFTKFTIGDDSTGGNAMDGKIGEIIVAKDLTTDERQKLEGYIAWKWDQMYRLPHDHPYKYDGTIFGYHKLWSPKEITTLGWWDAADRSTITESAGSVSQIDDISGNDEHLVQATGSEQPTTNTRSTNDYNVLDGDGTEKMANSAFPIPSSGDLNVFYFANYDSGGGSACFVSMDGASSNDWQFKTNSETNFDGELAINGIGSDVTCTGGPYDNASIFNLYFDYGSTYGVYVDGTADGSSAYTGNKLDSSMDFKIFANRGGAAYINGAIGEVIITEDVTTATRQKIEGYMAHKYGKTANLPGGHPYKTDPPLA